MTAAIHLQAGETGAACGPAAEDPALDPAAATGAAGGGTRGRNGVGATGLVAEPPSASVVRLGEAVAGLVAEDGEAFTAEVLGADLIALRAAVDRIEAVFTRRLARFGRLRGHRSWNCSSAVAFLRRGCRMSRGAAFRRVEMAEQLEALPRTRQAFADGLMGVEQAAAVAHVASQVGDEVVRSVEDVFLDHADRLHVDDFRTATRYLRHLADAEGVLEDTRSAQARRWWSMSRTLDDMWVIDARLGAEGGIVLSTALEAIVGPPVAGDERRTSQRRADGIVELARRSLDGGRLPTVGGQKPHLVLVAGLGSLQGTPHAGPPELAGVGPISAETARRIACDVTVESVIDGAELSDDAAEDRQGSVDVRAFVDHPASVVDPTSAQAMSATFRRLVTRQIRPLAAGRALRLIPPAMMRALRARDRACRVCGCDPRFCDAQHIVHWVHGGPTALFNLILLCRRCHTMVHEGAQRIELRPDGQVVLLAADGTVVMRA